MKKRSRCVSAVRSAEGRISESGERYLSLPRVDEVSRNVDDAIRETLKGKTREEALDELKQIMKEERAGEDAGKADDADVDSGGKARKPWWKFWGD